MKLLIHSQTSTVQPKKFGKGLVFPFHTLPGIWLLINIENTDNLCKQKGSLVSGEFPSQRPVTLSFDVFLDHHLNERLSNNRDAGDFRRHCAHYDVIIMGYDYNATWTPLCTTYVAVQSINKPCSGELGRSTFRWFLCYCQVILGGRQRFFNIFCLAQIYGMKFHDAWNSACRNNEHWISPFFWFPDYWTYL